MASSSQLAAQERLTLVREPTDNSPRFVLDVNFSAGTVYWRARRHTYRAQISSTTILFPDTYLFPDGRGFSWEIDRTTGDMTVIGKNGIRAVSSASQRGQGGW